MTGAVAPYRAFCSGAGTLVTSDWLQWHEAYSDPSSSLSLRLADVIAATASALDSAAPGSIRLLSLCAGDARDVANTLRDHPRQADVTGRVVELNPTLASRASTNLAAMESRVSVSCADASNPMSWQEFLPVDLLLLVGIFGNISDVDIQRTIKAVPAICRQDASIVWTRHRRTPDMTPTIRTLFDDVGCASRSFKSPGPNSYAVGTEKYIRVRSPSPLPRRLFSFIDSST